jgi:luciferase family oxidoreductase group 1
VGAVPPPLSVLDLSPVPDGAGSAEALRNTVDLARRAERLGYHRYWVAEHHNTPGLASAAPEVMIARVADATSRIRVGAGGIMLPNHSPLRVAEIFRVLEALHPGRIDLGLGRAPGTDGITAVALRRSRGPGAEDFPALLEELLAYGGDGLPEGHPFASVRAEPADVPLPPIWMLGSSEYGATVAAALGCGFAFARHLNPRGAAEVMNLYRDRFSPSRAMPEPRAILTVSAICAERSERADELSWSLALSVIRMRTGRPAKLPAPEAAMAHEYTPGEADQVRRYRRAQVLGDPGEVRAEIERLVAETRADEVMVMTTVHDHGERVRSYELLAEAFGLEPRPAEQAAAGA